MPYQIIDPSEKLQFGHDWSNELDADGSPSYAIASSSWAVTPQDEESPTSPLIEGGAIDDPYTTCLLSLCRRGEVYNLTNTITLNTDPAITLERTIVVRCANR